MMILILDFKDFVIFQCMVFTFYVWVCPFLPVSISFWLVDGLRCCPYHCVVSCLHSLCVHNLQSIHLNCIKTGIVNCFIRIREEKKLQFLPMIEDILIYSIHNTHYIVINQMAWQTVLSSFPERRLNWAVRNGLYEKILNIYLYLYICLEVRSY